MAKLDPNILAHLEWLGFVEPKGLVVSAPALVRAGAILDRRDAEGQRLLRACITDRSFDASKGPVPYLPDFRLFARTVLGWSFSPKAYVSTAECPVPPELCVPLADGEALRPDFAVRELEPKDAAAPWQLAVQTIDPALDFERPMRGDVFDAAPHSRMERLLRQTGVPAGLLFNGRAIRLISAPHGESSGWLDFKVADMLQTAGRPISAALRLLLSESRLLSVPRAQRLPALLEESRKFQNEVSERLAEQVLHALYELLRGFQSAHDASNGQLLHEPLTEHPDEVYRALLTTVLRLVFLLYAEERDMLPEDDRFVRYYSLAGLYERLREDAALFPDTMDQRYGAWAQLLVLFRMIYDGAESGSMRLPSRHGVLFDPDRFKFLEGRPSAGALQVHERIEAPLVPDGTIYRALEKLLVLDGERISYRALDVEQIGSVYETMMGFRLEIATGVSVAIKADKKQGAPTALSLESLLNEVPTKRAKWIHDRADRKLTDRVVKAVTQATTIEELHAALAPVIDVAATPDLVAPGAMLMQPSEERRRSGSHYTPRALTEPIVRTTLAPILARLRGSDSRSPTPRQILDLKVCDPAMGSGAFLVEACRQLGDALVEAWNVHGEAPSIPPDEDAFVYARRLIAQRCLYGVDRNPIAVDIAKVSLWLATLARDHAFTFLDHALRHGDSLVGLTRRQLEAFHWDGSKPPLLVGLGLRDALDRVTEHRRLIREADESVTDTRLRDLWDETEIALRKARLAGDLLVAAFFAAEGTKPRERKRSEFAQAMMSGQAERYLPWLDEVRDADLPLAPFHWQIEFPEVLDRENAGFDAFIGNPPFAGKNSIALANVNGYQAWLKQLHEESHGNADLVAHFFRRAFDLSRQGGAFGLIATNTIAQGDTRWTGLRWICLHGGEIYAGTRRVRWPGQSAAVVVSVVHVIKGGLPGPKILDNRSVPSITAFLFHRGGHEEPARLACNEGHSFQGSVVLGMGFIFDDKHADGVTTSLAEMERLLDSNPRNREAIFPYIGGEEVNTSPTHAHHRYVINFGERGEAECRQRWPDLMAIVEAKVKPERMNNNRETRKRYWWRFGETTPALFRAIAGLERVLVISRISNAFALAFLPAGMVYNEKIVVFPFSTYPSFAVLQSRPHEVWTRFFSSTLKDDLQYTPSACFETFPFPDDWSTHPALESVGKAYYEFRAALMARNNEGLTKTYNRFHNPDERDPDIMKLRQLHATIDRAVLDAYGWQDIATECDFFPDYEVDVDESGDKKQPWRYRWPNEGRDEVLARLLELNAEHAKKEARSGATAKKRGKRTASESMTEVPQPEDLFS